MIAVVTGSRRGIGLATSLELEQARTAAEHRALEEYFSDLAEKYTSDARRHDAMARGYRGHANDRSGSFAALAVHCEGLAKSSRESANAALAAAGAVMATALGWTPEHLAREAQRVAALYPPL